MVIKPVIDKKLQSRIVKTIDDARAEIEAIKNNGISLGMIAKDLGGLDIDSDKYPTISTVIDQDIDKHTVDMEASYNTVDAKLSNLKNYIEGLANVLLKPVPKPTSKPVKPVSTPKIASKPKPTSKTEPTFTSESKSTKEKEQEKKEQEQLSPADLFGTGE